MLGIGGGLGVVLAGPIVQHLSYHWLFWFPLVAVIVATVAIDLFVPESPVKTPGGIDWLGAALLVGRAGRAAGPVSQGTRWGWGSARRRWA